MSSNSLKTNTSLLVLFIVMPGTFLLGCKTLPVSSNVVTQAKLSNCDSLSLFIAQHWKVITPVTQYAPNIYMPDSVFMNAFRSALGKRQFDDCIYQLNAQGVFKYFGKTNMGNKYCLYAINKGDASVTLVFEFNEAGLVNRYSLQYRID